MKPMRHIRSCPLVKYAKDVPASLKVHLGFLYSNTSMLKLDRKLSSCQPPV